MNHSMFHYIILFHTITVYYGCEARGGAREREEGTPRGEGPAGGVQARVQAAACGIEHEPSTHPPFHPAKLFV